MAYVALNFGTSTLASGINASDTIINVQTGHGVRFAVGSNHSYLVLENTSGNTEIVKITGQTGDALTVVRAQDGTTARSWVSGDAIESRPCFAAISDIIAEADALGTAAVAAHLADTTDAHDASAISYNGATGLAATDVEAALDELDAEKAPLASPALTGTPTAPTAAAGASTTQLATTEFVSTAIPAGTVIQFAGNSAPTGYLKANGAEVSRTTYAALFGAIGTTFGAGNGSTTFNVPDLRGEFVRGWDDGRGVDSGRVFGSAQADELKAHTHTITTPSTYYTAAGTSNNGSWQSTASGNTGSTGGTETRPRNIALLFCIKY